MFQTLPKCLVQFLLQYEDPGSSETFLPYLAKLHYVRFYFRTLMKGFGFPKESLEITASSLQYFYEELLVFCELQWYFATRLTFPILKT